MREVQVESVAYAASAALGLGTSGYNSGYVASWPRERPDEEMRQHIVAVCDAAKEITDRLRLVMEPLLFPGLLAWRPGRTPHACHLWPLPLISRLIVFVLFGKAFISQPVSLVRLLAKSDWSGIRNTGVCGVLLGCRQGRCMTRLAQDVTCRNIRKDSFGGFSL